MGMCSPLAIKDKRTMPQNKIPDNLVTTLPSGQFQKYGLCGSTVRVDNLSSMLADNTRMQATS